MGTVPPGRQTAFLTMSPDFQHDVFLSHSAKDKTVVGPLAERAFTREGVAMS
jgi:hypothetical protein